MYHTLTLCTQKIAHNFGLSECNRVKYSNSGTPYGMSFHVSHCPGHTDSLCQYSTTWSDYGNVQFD